jgi:hypothetical protein
MISDSVIPDGWECPMHGEMSEGRYYVNQSDGLPETDCPICGREMEPIYHCKCCGEAFPGLKLNYGGYCKGCVNEAIKEYNAIIEGIDPQTRKILNSEFDDLALPDAGVL